MIIPIFFLIIFMIPIILFQIIKEYFWHEKPFFLSPCIFLFVLDFAMRRIFFLTLFPLSSSYSRNALINNLPTVSHNHCNIAYAAKNYFNQLEQYFHFKKCMQKALFRISFKKFYSLLCKGTSTSFGPQMHQSGQKCWYHMSSPVCLLNIFCIFDQNLPPNSLRTWKVFTKFFLIQKF